MSLWRLDESITPIHTHDDREFLLHHSADGSTEVVSPRRANEIAAANVMNSEGLGACAPDHGPTRRSVLGFMAAAGLLSTASTQPRYAFAADGVKRDTLVVIFLRGAADGLQMLVPYGESAYYKARPGIGIKPSEVIKLDSRFGMHPGMRPLKVLWDAGDLAFIPAAGNRAANRSHFDAQLDMERAAPANIRSGWLGRHLSSVSSNKSMVRAITVGNRAVAATSTTFATASFNGSVDGFGLSVWEGLRPEFSSAISGMYRRAGGDIAQSARETMTGINKLAVARKVRAGSGYPNTPFGRGMSETARVIKSGAPVEAVCIDRDDWDMHANQGAPTAEWGWMRRALDDFSTTLAAFQKDLGSAWGRTTVVVMTEFGRRVAENSTNGTDHGHGGLMMVAGGHVNGGKVHGRWPGLAPSQLRDGDVEVANDYRQVIAEILTKRLRTPNVQAVFPGLSAKPIGIIE